MCFCNGKVILESFPKLPPWLHELFFGFRPLSENFLSKIKEYISKLEMASWKPRFKYEGHVFHIIGNWQSATASEE